MLRILPAVKMRENRAQPPQVPDAASDPERAQGQEAAKTRRQFHRASRPLPITSRQK